MNLPLFLSVVAWGVLLISGFINVIMLGQLILVLFTPRAKATLGSGFFVWPLVFTVALAYLIAS